MICFTVAFLPESLPNPILIKVAIFKRCARIVGKTRDDYQVFSKIVTFSSSTLKYF